MRRLRAAFLFPDHEAVFPLARLTGCDAPFADTLRWTVP
jgi:hypothetical protein